MINGIGIDVVEIDRIREAVEKYGEKFLEKVYTPHEIKYCTRRKQYRIPELAVRFAAKEAYTKVYKKFLTPLNFVDVEVLTDEFGAPYIESKYMPEDTVKVSISHSNNYVIAICLKE